MNFDSRSVKNLETCRAEALAPPLVQPLQFVLGKGRKRAGRKNEAESELEMVWYRQRCKRFKTV